MVITETKVKSFNLPSGSSFPDAAVFYYCKQCYEDAVYRRHDVIGLELDVYIPSLNVAIEYDGSYYHNHHLMKDSEKNQLCKDSGIKLIRVVEEDSEEFYFEDGMMQCFLDDIGVDYVIRHKPYNDKSLNNCIKDLFATQFGIYDIDIDVTRDKSAVIVSAKREFKFDKRCADLCGFWHPSKNGILKPSDVEYNSTVGVWWVCANDKEFYLSPNYVRQWGFSGFCLDYMSHGNCKKCIASSGNH